VRRRSPSGSWERIGETDGVGKVKQEL